MRTLAVLTLALTLTGLTGMPAAAQNGPYQWWVQLRYWGSGLDFGNPAPPSAHDNGSGWGGTVRLDHRTMPWSLSFRYDTLSITPNNWVWDRFSVWDASVHYRFGPSLDSYFGLLAGWQGTSLNAPGSPPNTGSATGLRLGVEALHRSGPWYFTGEASYAWLTNSGFTGFNLANGNATDLRAALGYEFQGGWGLEVGWRQYTWRIPDAPGSGCPTAPGCEFRFSGITAALTFRR
ncbi:MAG: hypothetical protein QN157_02830 [Armatimonadota bacterium]|nr:hypothetical protein [Armatimonadota bacterium]